MPALTRGDVVIVLYPFSDGSGAKPRPAVVVSSEELNEVSRDVIVAQITSRVGPAPRLCDFDMVAWQAVKLRAPSRVRASRLASVQLDKVRMTLGPLASADFELLETNLRRALGL
jgi:mRNA interferase MazF